VNDAAFAWVAVILVLPLALGALDVFALDDVNLLRCNRETIAIGDTPFDVYETCGEPDKRVRLEGGNVERWVYDFGPTEFLYYLKFVNGRLARIQTGEYGSEIP
jgi:hypothetical protein